MSAHTEVLAQAQQFHQAGYLSRAEQLYRQVLEADPANAEVWLLLGNALAGQGKLDEAILQYRQSVQVRPDFGVGSLNLADALQRQGHLDEAVACLRQALERRPDFPEAHFNLANTLRALGRMDESAHHYRAAVRLRPDFAEAHNNLANVLLALTQADEAVVHLEQAIRLRPNYLEAYYNLGNAYREQDRPADALASYRRALQLRPDYGPAHNGVAELLLEQGNLDQARVHFRQALHNNPSIIRTLLHLASHGLYTAAEPGIDQLRGLLANPRLSLDAASQVHFTLGNLLDRVGAWDEAFEHFRQGNALRRELFQQSGTAFDAAEHTRRIDRLIEFFSPAYLDRVRGFGHDTEVPVFIVGMPRSGTTLVEQILSHHPQVFGAGERRDLPRIMADLPTRLGGDYPACLARLDAAGTRGLAEEYLGRLTRTSGAAARVTDKMPENLLHLGLIATLFPRAHVIHCRRDARDVCVSCFFQFFKGLNFTWDLEDLGHYYREYERLMAHWRAVLPLPIHDVVYEDLIADQAAVSRRMVEFCGLPWDERCLRYHENRRAVKTASVLQVRQPIYASSVGRWRRYEAHLAPLLAALGA
jgi:tetratricopeptide (TPR) repeat protein